MRRTINEATSAKHSQRIPRKRSEKRLVPFVSLLYDIFDFDSCFHNYLSTAVRSIKHERNGRFDA